MNSGASGHVRGSSEVLSSRAQNAEKAIIEELHEKYLTDGVASLAAGVSYIEPPRACTDGALKALGATSSPLHRYGDVIGDADLLDEVCCKLERENRLDMSHCDVMITAGANQAFVNVIMCICDVGDEVVLFRPYYFSHLVALQLTNVLPVVAETDKNFQPDLESLASCLTEKTKAVVLVSPGNPSGAVADQELVEKLTDVCLQQGVWLIADEAYEHFVYDNSRHFSPRGANVINIFTMSKSYALAGYRVGYVVFPKGLKDAMLKANDTIPTHACRLSQYMARCALQDAPSFPRIHAEALQQQRNILWEVVKEFGTVHSRGAFYFFVPLSSDISDMEAAATLSQKFQVLVVPGSAFGMSRYLRVSYAALQVDEFKVAAERLRKGLSFLLSA